jgi:hypothetical protein
MTDDPRMAPGADPRVRAVELKASELPPGEVRTPQELAEHFGPVMFTGGPPARFEEVGRRTLVALLESGLYPHSSVLDIGSGALRIGYWLLNFLQPDRYCGLEPDDGLTWFGTNHIVGPETIAAKRPRFDNNTDFDLTVFDRSFDFFVARSIWTHTSRAMISTMLDGFLATARAGGVFLASYVPADDGVGYEGEEWVALPLVPHAIEWVAEECRVRGLAVRQLPEVINLQPWLRIERASADLPAGLVAPEAQDRARGLGSRVKSSLRALR